MKKVVMLVVLFVGFVGFSQEKKNEEYQKDAVELMKLQSGNTMKNMLEQFTQRVPEENRKAFRKELQESLDKFNPSLAMLYMESFTRVEIKEILEFYKSPIGKKILKEMPELMDHSMEIRREWMMSELQPLVQKYQ